jgi:hypothetical protein
MTDTGPPSLPNPEAASEWYYEQQGKRIGPVADEVIKKQLEWENISADSLVWNRKLGADWRPLRTVDSLWGGTPPPLPATHINDSFAWIIAFIPVIGAIIEKLIEQASGEPLTGMSLLLPYWIANSVIALIDAKKNRKQRSQHKKPTSLFLGNIYSSCLFISKSASFATILRLFYSLVCILLCRPGDKRGQLRFPETPSPFHPSLPIGCRIGAETIARRLV